jgi:NAD(P)-dependent dehydrogenase (short-subunit alcohol dehydrogenase family)
MNPRSKIAVLKAIPGGRFGEAEEFAHAVWFAVENDYLNGCNLEISGGLINPNI